MPNKTALADVTDFAPVSSRFPHRAAAQGVRRLQPLDHVLDRLGLQLECPPPGLPDCEVRRFAPGSPICTASAPRRECFIVRHGLVLRRGADDEVLKATAVAGADEALALHGSRTARHAETLRAITHVELAVIDASTLRRCETSEFLLSRLVAGPQSIAWIRCWARFGWIAQARGAERLRRGLATLAQRLGVESHLLADIRLELDALAPWLAMAVPEVSAAASRLQAQGLMSVRDGVVRSIHLRAASEPPR